MVALRSCVLVDRATHGISGSFDCAFGMRWMVFATYHNSERVIFRSSCSD